MTASRPTVEAVFKSPPLPVDSSVVSDGPTQGVTDAEDANGQWRSARWAAVAVRVAVVVGPFVAAWFAVSGLSDSFFRPPGWTGFGVWILQAVIVGTAVSMATERFARRLLPLATLLNLSLVFPDQAPSRFGVALRSGSLRKLRAGLSDVERDGLGGSDRDAAQQAVELIGLLSHHDRLTRGHTERVRAHADLIAQEMGLSDEQRSRLAWGSLLHDVGKLTVPTEILNKRGRPTDAEWAILENHPKATGELLAPLEGWLGEWSKAGPEHHERWDGNGYPAGLAGHEISLAGRITTQPANGIAWVHTQGPLDNRRIMYQPDAGFVGVEVFTYEICDLDGSCAHATVTLTMTDP